LFSLDFLKEFFAFCFVLSEEYILHFLVLEGFWLKVEGQTIKAFLPVLQS